MTVAHNALDASAGARPCHGSQLGPWNTGWKAAGYTQTSTQSSTVTYTSPTTVVGVTFESDVQVEAAVTFKGCWFKYYLQTRVGGYATVEDSELGVTTGVDTAGSGCVKGGSFTLRRCYIHHIDEGLRANTDVLIEDTFIGPLHPNGDLAPHDDVIQCSGGAGGSGVTLRRVYSDAHYDTGARAACAGFYSDHPTDQTITLEDCYLSGGNYTLALHDASSSSGLYYVLNRNRWETGSYQYGPVDVGSPASLASHITWNDNKETDGTVLGNPGAP